MSTHKLTPVEPTPEMLEAGADWCGQGLGTDEAKGRAATAYKSMLAAAPEVEQEPAAWVSPMSLSRLRPDSSAHCTIVHKQKSYCDGMHPLYLHPPAVSRNLPAVFTKWLEAFVELSDSAGIEDNEECWVWPAPPGAPHFFDSYPKLTTGVMRELHECLLESRPQPAPDVSALVEALEELLRADAESCQYDSDGYCQNHILDHVSDGCRVHKAREALAVYRKQGGEA